MAKKLILISIMLLIFSINANAYDVKGGTHFDNDDVYFTKASAESALDFNDGEPWTIMAWIRLQPGDTTIVWCSKYIQSPTHWMIRWEAKDTGELNLRLYMVKSGVGTFDVHTDYNWEAVLGEDYHHIAIVYDGLGAPGSAIIYKDGVSLTLDEATTTLGANAVNNNEAFKIGSYNNTRGYLDIADQYIFGTNLSVSEINTIASQRGIMGKCEGLDLRYYCPLSNSNGAVMPQQDLSGSGLHVEISSSTGTSPVAAPSLR